MGEQWILDVKSELSCSNAASERVQAWRKRSIYKVPETFARHNRKAFIPFIASFGPYHHGQPHLMPMEEHKRRVLMDYLRRAKKPLEDIVEALRKEVRLLMDSYDSLDEQWARDDNRFLELMIVDGCFMLEVLVAANCNERDRLRYDVKDPVFRKSSVLFWLGIDALKLENQLPILVHSTLADFTTDQLILDLGIPKPPAEESVAIEDAGVHWLDFYRKSMILHGEYWCSNSFTTTPVLSAVELFEAGVVFRRSESSSLKDISFNKGVLSLPLLQIADGFESTIHNLIAFEKLHGAGQEVTAYVFFMDQIINSAKDVALLRESGIFKVRVGSDDEIAGLFNSFTRGLVLEYTQSGDGVDVVKALNEYCSSRWHEWRANFVHTYLKNPWVFISLVAAFILLLLTVLQTVYTLLAYY